MISPHATTSLFMRYLHIFNSIKLRYTCKSYIVRMHTNSIIFWWFCTNIYWWRKECWWHNKTWWIHSKKTFLTSSVMRNSMSNSSSLALSNIWLHENDHNSSSFRLNYNLIINLCGWTESILTFENWYLRRTNFQK